jgi:hypothetical protein
LCVIIMIRKTFKVIPNGKRTAATGNA